MNFLASVGKTAIGCVVILFIFGIFFGSNDHNGSAPGTAAPPDRLARTVCAEFAKKMAHDPSSVEFVERDKWPTAQNGTNWTVFMQFRAKNAMGALTLGSYTCKASHIGDQWKLVDFVKVM